MKTIDFIYTRSFLLFFINIFWTTILPPSTLGHVDLFSKLYIKSHSIDVLQRNIPLIHRFDSLQSLKIFSLYEEYHSYITHVTAAYCPQCCRAAHVSRRVQTCLLLLTSHHNCAFRDGTTYTCVHDIAPSLRAVVRVKTPRLPCRVSVTRVQFQRAPVPGSQTQPRHLRDGNIINRGWKKYRSR